MTHQWHDSYRHQKTPAHHLDPRSKLFVGLLFVGVVLCAPRFTKIQAVAYPLLIALLAGLAGVSLRSLLRRLATLSPFMALMLFSAWFSHLSRAQAGHVFGKAALSLAAMSLVALTTPFPDLLRALRQMRLPRLLALFLAFLYRYSAVLREEALHMERAWSSRYFGRFAFRQWPHFGHIVASLFVRSYERAERIFAAMQSRGFSRESPPAGAVLHFEIWDGFFILLVSSLLLFLRWGPL